MHPAYGMSRTYLETLASVPFNQWTPEAQENVERARTELDAGHSGLQNAKRRILEYVAVQKISRGTVRGPILCFVGPPGVGDISTIQHVCHLNPSPFRQDLVGTRNGEGPRAEVRSSESGRRPRRSGDPWTSAHLHWSHAGAHYIGSRLLCAQPKLNGGYSRACARLELPIV